jgi:hypothetical protein
MHQLIKRLLDVRITRSQTVEQLQSRSDQTPLVVGQQAYERLDEYCEKLSKVNDRILIVFYQLQCQYGPQLVADLYKQLEELDRLANREEIKYDG